MARPRKPTAYLELTGAFDRNPQRRRPGEPKAHGEAKKPAFVRGRAAKIWNQYAPVLTAMGILKAVDSHMFSVWCCLAAEFEEDPGRMNAARIAQMRAVGLCFGLDPSARARLSLPSAAKSPEQEAIAAKYFSWPTNTRPQ